MDTATTALLDSVYHAPLPGDSTQNVELITWLNNGKLEKQDRKSLYTSELGLYQDVSQVHERVISVMVLALCC